MGIKNNNIVQAWLVLVLCLCFGSALAAVHVVLSPAIEANKLNETLGKVPGLVLGEETAAEMQEKGETLEIESVPVQVEKSGRSLSYVVYKVLSKGSRVGWVLKSSGQGYADKIELLVGMDGEADIITGIFVLDQKETPGLGNKVIETGWRGQFIGKTAASPLAVTKSGASIPEEIDAVTGATISSDAVVQIVNTALADVRPELNDIIRNEEP
jgi:electron transport complex protein RnfG